MPNGTFINQELEFEDHLEEMTPEERSLWTARTLYRMQVYGCPCLQTLDKRVTTLESSRRKRDISWGSIGALIGTIVGTIISILTGGRL